MDKTVLSIGIGLIIALIGIIYRSLSLKIENKVDKDLYIQTITSIEKALDKINGTADKLHQVVNDVAAIQDKFLTIKEHDYKCEIAKRDLIARMKNETSVQS